MWQELVVVPMERRGVRLSTILERDYAVLVILTLYQRPGQSLSSLTRETGGNPRTISSVVDVLEEEGVVKKERGSAPLRGALQYEITLTDDGANLGSHLNQLLDVFPDAHDLANQHMMVSDLMADARGRAVFAALVAGPLALDDVEKLVGDGRASKALRLRMEEAGVVEVTVVKNRPALHLTSLGKTVADQVKAEQREREEKTSRGLRAIGERAQAARAKKDQQG